MAATKKTLNCGDCATVNCTAKTSPATPITSDFQVILNYEIELPIRSGLKLKPV